MVTYSCLRASSQKAASSSVVVSVLMQGVYFISYCCAGPSTSLLTILRPVEKRCGTIAFRGSDFKKAAIPIGKATQDGWIKLVFGLKNTLGQGNFAVPR